MEVFNETATSGITVSGNTDLLDTYNIITTSGSTVSGSANQTFNDIEENAGGSTVSGSAQQTFNDVEETAGGSTVSGSANQTFNDIEENAGGSTVSGSAQQTFNDVEETAGGTTVSGSTDPLATYNITATSGITVSGSTDPLVTYNITATSGTTVSGSTDPLATYNITETSGSTVSGSTDVYVITEQYISSNGIIVSNEQSKISLILCEYVGTGGIILEGFIIELMIKIPNISGGIISEDTYFLVECTYNIEKYIRGQVFIRGKAKKERLRNSTKIVIKNIGRLCLKSPNILNAPPEDENKIIVPSGDETPVLDPNSYRIIHSPGWCEFGELPTGSAYLPAVVKNRQRGYVPSKISVTVVKPGVQLSKLA